MSYLSENLAGNESVLYQAHYHWKIWIVPSAIFTLWIRPILLVVFDEFAITDRRIIMKTGVISQKVFDMTHSHIETVNVEQSIVGRILGYGTVTIIGSGGTRESFTDISHPNRFRKAFWAAFKAD